MAQDFAASFGYGMMTNDDKHISLGDEVGVSLAAIKGLNQTVKEQNAELQALKKEVADLKALVESLAPAKNARP
jgi:archaellum component FlaC